MSDQKILTRYLASDEIVIDREKRTLTFPFSSTRPVERWGYFEVDGEEILGRFDETISHLPSHWDLERVKQRVCPFLKNHNRNTKLGTVQSVKFDSERAFATVKLRRTKDADEFLDDLENETAGGVSFGYVPKKYRVITSAEYEGKGWDRRLVKKALLEAIDTELFEVSNEEVPADPSVGFGKEAAFSLKTVEIIGNVNIEGEKQVTDNEIPSRADNIELRTQNELLAAQVKQLQQQVADSNLKTEVTSSYTALRQQAERLVREGKLSKAEFDEDFRGSSEAQIKTLLAMDSVDLKTELKTLERYLGRCESRSPLLPTSLKTDSEPLPAKDAETQAKKEEEDSEKEAEAFVKKQELPSWKSYSPIA